jgi:hypothetical protein
MKNKKNRALFFANVILGSSVLLSLLAIIYVWQKSSAGSDAAYFKLIALFSTGLLLLSITLFMHDTWKFNIAIALFSTFIAAYSAEFVLFIHHTRSIEQPKIDTRNKFEVIRDLRAEGIDAWPQVRTMHFTKNTGLFSDNNKSIFPLGGISQKTIVYCNESGQYKIFQSDEHGFNNPVGLYRKGSLETILVGDSFTLGNCVMAGEDIASRLRTSGISSLNLGNGGNGPLIELGLLREYVEPFRPQLVFWIYYEGNDLIELAEERKVSMLMRYLEDNYTQNLLDQQQEIDAILIKHVNSRWMKELPLIANQPRIALERESGENILKIFRLWYLRNRIGLTNKSREVQNPDRITNYKEQLPLFSEILAAAHRRTSEWGGNLYFIYLPSMERYVYKNYDRNFYDRADVLAIVHNIGIPLIDFHKVLSRHADPLSLVPHAGAHYNADGYKLLSDTIVSQLRQDGFFRDE